MIIGVLALQGDFANHLDSLRSYKVECREVRTKDDLQKVHALIMPGGESTTMAKLLVSSGLDQAIIGRVKNGMPVWGTCAGAILLAKNVITQVPLESYLNLIDITVERNSYGRQTESFVVELELLKKRFTAFFIRAPRITKVGKGVKVLIKDKNGALLARSENVLVSTFHSEFSSPNVVLEYFLKEMVVKKEENSK